MENGVKELKDLMNQISPTTVQANKILRLMSSSQFRQLLLQSTVRCSELDITEDSLKNIKPVLIGRYFVEHFSKVEESNKKVVGIKVTKDSNEIELILSEDR